jgi:cytochrome c oxidase assembly factor CtaG
VGLLAHADVPLSELSSAWNAEPLVLAAAAVALGLFAQAFIRLRARGRADHAPFARAVLFSLGVLVGVLAVVSPLDAAAENYLLSAHMLQHVLLIDLVPLLLVLALRGPLTFFFLPAPVLRVVASWSPLRLALSFLLLPVVTITVWAAVVYAWHVPALYDATLSRAALHDLEHALFLLVGLLVWIQLIDPARHERLTRGGRILFAIGLLALGHPVIDALVFSDTALYSAYADQPQRLLGLSPLTDQKLAGLIMFVEQTVTLGACIGVLLWPYLRARRSRIEEARTA